MLAKLLKFRGFAGIRVCTKLSRELASTGGKSVIFANSEKGYVTIHVTKSASRELPIVVRIIRLRIVEAPWHLVFNRCNDPVKQDGKHDDA